MFQKTIETLRQSRELRTRLNELFLAVPTKERVFAVDCVAAIAGQGAFPRTAIEFVRRGVLAGFSFALIKEIYTSAEQAARATGESLFGTQEAIHQLIKGDACWKNHAEKSAEAMLAMVRKLEEDKSDE
jgi:hypothetical protein